MVGNSSLRMQPFEYHSVVENFRLSSVSFGLKLEHLPPKNDV